MANIELRRLKEIYIPTEARQTQQKEHRSKTVEAGIVRCILPHFPQLPKEAWLKDVNEQYMRII